MAAARAASCTGARVGRSGGTTTARRMPRNGERAMSSASTAALSTARKVARSRAAVAGATLPASSRTTMPMSAGVSEPSVRWPRLGDTWPALGGPERGCCAAWPDGAASRRPRYRAWSDLPAGRATDPGPGQPRPRRDSGQRRPWWGRWWGRERAALQDRGSGPATDRRGGGGHCRRIAYCSRRSGGALGIDMGSTPSDASRATGGGRLLAGDAFREVSFRADEAGSEPGGAKRTGERDSEAATSA